MISRLNRICSSSPSLTARRFRLPQESKLSRPNEQLVWKSGKKSVSTLKIVADLNSVSNRRTGPEAIFDVALEDDAVALGEPKSLVGADQGVALRGEPRENGRVDGASLVVDDGEGGPAVLGHGHAAPGEDAVRSLVGDLDLEGELVPDAHGLHLAAARVEYADPRGGGLGRGGDADHVRVADRHHAEGDVLRAGVVGAADLVDLVRLGHHDGVPLDDHGVGVDSALQNHLLVRILRDKGDSLDFNFITTVCVLQSCPPMVRSRRNELLLITSTLHVSERPRA